MSTFELKIGDIVTFKHQKLFGDARIVSIEDRIVRVSIPATNHAWTLDLDVSQITHVNGEAV